MSFFTSRTSFATKLLAAAGLDFETLFRAGDSEALKAKLAASANLDAVKKLFTTADLDLDKMLAAGPDSLKAHLEMIDGDAAEVAEALKEAAQIKTKVSVMESTIGTISASRDGLVRLIEAIGLSPADTNTPDGAKAAFSAHVKKQVAGEMALLGHPPVKETPGMSHGAKTMSREAFGKLTPRAKRDFSVNGGKLTD